MAGQCSTKIESLGRDERDSAVPGGTRRVGLGILPSTKVLGYFQQTEWKSHKKWYLCQRYWLPWRGLWRRGRFHRPFEENLGEESDSQEKRFFVEIKGAGVQGSDFFARRSHSE